MTIGVQSKRMFSFTKRFVSRHFYVHFSRTLDEFDIALIDHVAGFSNTDAITNGIRMIISFRVTETQLRIA